MNEHVRVKESEVEYQFPVEVSAPARLPSKVLVFEQRAKQAVANTEKFIGYADGLIGPVGWDGFLGLIPGIGALYTFYGWGVLMNYAAATRASFGTRAHGTILCGSDLLIGIWLGVGDIIDFLLRSHHLFGSRIIEEARLKLDAIEQARMRALPDGTISAEELEELNGIIFRNGRSEQSNNFRLLLYGGVALLITYGVFVA